MINRTMDKFIKPNDVLSPKRQWVLIAILDEGSASEAALAIGRWDDQPVLAVRWNGSKDNRLGNPQSRGLPTWFILPDKYREAILGTLPDDDKLRLARSIFPNRGTTIPGFVNKNGQVVVRKTSFSGTDHGQKVYQLACTQCGTNYGANGTDIHERLCPKHQGGKPGLPIE
jgi:hypothetical protein